jgi:CIC family chloride channel protein
LNHEIPISPSMEAALRSTHIHKHEVLVSPRVVFISLLSVALACVATLIAIGLTSLIGLITNLAFYQRVSAEFVSPAGHHVGLWVLLIPAIGGVLVGIMARYGSQAIRGHGIPEAMEQILFNESRIPARITFLKPISAAISIGTGGPFGAEGPIIATGGALGSVLGQVIHVTASERKTLLAAGAAAGMTAIFGSPVAAILLAIELLLFEFRPRSFIPVAAATVMAAAARFWLITTDPVFPMPGFAQPSQQALFFYVLEGALLGVVSIGITKLVYWIEDLFEHLPVHWMWWPALGGLVVGGVGYFSPHTLGVGYDNIEHILSGELAGTALLVFCVMKLISWSISLGSGTSGGTLAPLFTIGGGFGAVLGSLVLTLYPHSGIDPRVAGLVGMAATFAGASRALLASIVFAFEITRQPLGLVPLLGGCTASYLVSALMMSQTIMTEKIARRGRLVPSEYHADPLESARVGEVATQQVISFSEGELLEQIRTWISSGDSRYQHQGFPVLDAAGKVKGLVTRRDLLETRHSKEQPVSSIIMKPAVVIDPRATLRQAATCMVEARVGRLVVTSPEAPGVVLGILTRRDLLSVNYRKN